MRHSGGDVCFTIVLSVIAIFIDQCCAVIYERHIIHVPLYIHVVHHHHRQSKGQKLQKVPNFRPLPPVKAPLQQQPQHFSQLQQLQHWNQNSQHSSQIIHPRHPQQIQQQKGGAHPALDAQWIHPSQMKQITSLPANHPRGQKPATQGKLKQSSPPRGSPQQHASPEQSPRPTAPYSTLYSRRPGAYRVPSSVRYVARHRTPSANDLSSYWYAYG